MAKYGLFMDLDGTIIQTISGEQYPVDRDDWSFNLGVPEMMKEFQDAGYMIFIVSNQGGIEEGYVNVDDFKYKLQDIRQKLADKYQVAVKDAYFCESNSKDNPYRKPNPGMAIKAANDYNVNLLYSVMVGDASGGPGSFSNSDLKFAENAGIAKYMDIGHFLICPGPGPLE